MLGPMVAISLGNIYELPFLFLPVCFENIVQVILGFYLGANITRKNLKELKVTSFPATANAIWSLVITFAFGYFLYYTTQLSLATSVLSSSPGGAPEVSMIAMAVNADVATVTVMQMARLLAVLSMVPLLSKKASSLKKPVMLGIASNHRSLIAPEQAIFDRSCHNGISNYISKLFNPGVGIALAGGLILYYLKVPAGYMVGAMIAVGTASVCGLKIKPLPEKVRTIVYISTGILIGQYFTREAMMGIVDIYPIMFLLTGLMLLFCAALAIVISKLTGWRLSVCLLATAPGGLISMTIIATEMDCDPLKVSLLHLARLVTIKLTLPLVILLTS